MNIFNLTCFSFFNFKFRYFFVFLTFQLISHLILANVITVGPAGDYQKIQDAIDNSYNGDEIIVSEGTYKENINFLGREIILRSTNPIDENIVKNTIINGNGQSSVVSFIGSESANCILSGFTITYGSYGYGGGISGMGTKATIKYNIITKNEAKRMGGGLWGCNGIVENNSIIENEAEGWIVSPPPQPNIIVGHEGALSECNGVIKNNIISKNSAATYGGGLYSCNGTIQSNIITDNTNIAVFLCGGIIQNNIIANNQTTGMSYCDGSIQNNTIYGNIGRGLFQCGGIILNCIIWGNTQDQVYECPIPLYSCIQGGAGGGIGNIADDPKFTDPTNGDFHLQLGSPCIDSGNKYYLMGEFIVDIDGEGRIADSSVDIGCDEYNSNPDSDGDFLIDTHESIQGTNPHNPDTDGDGLNDGTEILRGTSPNIYNIPSAITVPEDYSSIQQSIFFSFPGEIITVEQGIYKETIHFLGKNVIFQSTNPFDRGVVSNTIIDGEGIRSILYFSGQEDETCIVRGFTLQNGYGRNGGGISGNGTLAIIENNKIMNNIAYNYGGGLYQCNGLIQNNTILNNTVQIYGGGLYDCNGTIQNNLIVGNQSNYRGGGLYYSNGLIQNNVISNNSAQEDGGGLYYCFDKIYNNTIYGNSAINTGGGLYSCSGEIINNIIWQNTASSDNQMYNCSLPYYCCIQDWLPRRDGNINQDPQLVDPINRNFHLKLTSPCIDAGEFISGLTKDFEGDNRPFNGTSEPRGDGSDFDIGADEYVPSTTNVTSWIYW